MPRMWTAAFLAGLGASACAGQAPSRPVPDRPRVLGTFAPTAAPTRSEVSIDLQVSTRARYAPSLLGAPKPTLRIVIRNAAAAPLDVSDLRVRLAATHSGVAYGCAEDASRLGAREPSSVAPGGTATFDRTLDCALPLVGAYAVRVAVAFGKGAFAVPREIRAFELTVSAPPAVEPRRIEAIPGLFCAFGASDVLFKGESRSGAVVSLVNGSKRPIALPPSISLVVRLYRLGSAIPCEDEPVLLGPPPVLAPGAIYRVPFHVSCLGLSVPGTYEVEARLLIGAGPAATTAVEIGRLRVDVSADHRLAPWAPLR